MMRIHRIARLLICFVPAWPVVGDSSHEFGLYVDSNQDGIIGIRGLGDRRVPIDTTSPEEPFVFWINDDQDDRSYFETVPVKQPDVQDSVINSKRDLEDFARLHLALDDLSQRSLDTGSELVFSWQPTEGDPGIRLFWAASPNGSGRYLTDADDADAQMEQPMVDGIGEVRVGAPLVIPSDQVQNLYSTANRLYFLFEGASIGSGRLLAELRGSDGSVVAQTHVDLALYQIKSLYPRVRVRWPLDRPAYSYFTGGPPELELNWEDDPVGYPFVRPWYEEDRTIVFVIGWTKESREGYMNSLIEALETTYKRLWHRGYRGRFVAFRWDTRKYMTGMGLQESEWRAYKSGKPLKDYVASLPPDHRVYVLGHSMGGTVLAESLRLGLDADAVLFLQSVVPSEALDPDQELYYPGAEKVVTPDLYENMGYRGMVESTEVPVYNFYNQGDIAFMGWNAVQKSRKPVGNFTRGYVFDPSRKPGDQVYLKYYWFFRRPVTDPHEALAFVSRPRTYAVGAESRINGIVTESVDLNGPEHQFGLEHGAQFSREIQETTAFYDLLLDTFNIRYNGLEP